MERASRGAARNPRSMLKTIEGVRLAYDDAGRGEVLVLLHGFPFDRAVWDAQFAELARRVRVIRIDLRGSGESGVGPGPALMETLAGDVFGLLEALEVERVMLAGHSMGGYVALAFFRMYAERVSGLALVASHAGADSPARAAAREREADDVGANGLAVILDSVVANVLAAETPATQPALVERVRAIAARQDPAGAAAQIIGMKERVDSGDLLEDISVPALIIAGRDDRLIAPHTLEQTAQAIAGCEFVCLPRAGHLPMLEAPEATTAALERWIARCTLNGRADARISRVNRA